MGSPVLINWAARGLGGYCQGLPVAAAVAYRRSMAWTDEDLWHIGGAEELQVSSARPDGSLRPYVTIWVVRAGDDLYIRSAYGATNGWYRRARASGTGRIRAGGVERDV